MRQSDVVLDDEQRDRSSVVVGITALVEELKVESPPMWLGTYLFDCQECRANSAISRSDLVCRSP